MMAPTHVLVHRSSGDESATAFAHEFVNTDANSLRLCTDLRMSMHTDCVVHVLDDDGGEALCLCSTMIDNVADSHCVCAAT